MHPAPQLLMFDTFRFNSQSRELLRVSNEGPATAIPLGSRTADLLLLFLQRPGDLVTKNEIMNAVWPNAAMEESNLTVQISALRRALDTERGGPSSIQTVPGRGYRFTLPVTSTNVVARSDVPPDDGVGIAARQDGSLHLTSKSSAETTDAAEPELKNPPAPFHILELASRTQERLTHKIDAEGQRVATPTRTWLIVVSAASAAALAAAVAFYLFATRSGSPVATAVKTQNTPAATTGVLLQGVNLSGSDYSSFQIGSAEPGLCQNACRSDPKCAAWTYVQPGLQGDQAKCWLKSRVPAKIQNMCCISGVERAEDNAGKRD
jgi:DNA-binding winged helix-turn-helix (wHTH) protein